MYGDAADQLSFQPLARFGVPARIGVPRVARIVGGHKFQYLSKK